MKGVSQLARALEKTEKEIKETEEIELKITKEVESGLPKLNSHVLVNIWSAFETCFNEYCVLSIVSNPSLAASESMKKIRIPAAYLYQSDPTATASAVLEEVVRSTGASMKGGLGRFTCVLEHLGINVALEPEIRKDFIIASKLRNVIVHRFGIADARFVTECPDVDVEIGQKVLVTRDRLDKTSWDFRRFAVKILEAVPSYKS